MFEKLYFTTLNLTMAVSGKTLCSQYQRDLFVVVWVYTFEQDRMLVSTC